MWMFDISGGPTCAWSDTRRGARGPIAPRQPKDVDVVSPKLSAPGRRYRGSAGSGVGGARSSCRIATSCHPPSLKPTRRSRPTRSKPNLACSALLASLGWATGASATWNAAVEQTGGARAVERAAGAGADRLRVEVDADLARPAVRRPLGEPGAVGEPGDGPVGVGDQPRVRRLAGLDPPRRPPRPTAARARTSPGSCGRSARRSPHTPPRRPAVASRIVGPSTAPILAGGPLGEPRDLVSSSCARHPGPGGARHEARSGRRRAWGAGPARRRRSWSGPHRFRPMRPGGRSGSH